MDSWLITNGALVTLDASDRFVPAGFLQVEKGKIAALGEGKSRTDLTPGPFSPSLRFGDLRPAREGAEYTFDATGCVVMPGLVNAHSHVFLTMLRGLSDDETLEPWLDTLSPAIGAMTPEDMRRSTALGCREALRTGTTCICECCRYAPQLMAEEASRIGLRCIAGGMPASEWFGRPLPTDVPGLVAATLEIRDHPERYRGLATPYLGAHSTYNCSPDFLVELKGHARALGLRFNVHLAETRGEVETIRQRYGKTPVRFLYDLGLLDQDTIADHCVWLTEEDQEIFKSSGAGVAHCPVSNAKLASGVAPITRYLQAQIPVGLSTDSVVSNNGLNMFEEMRASVLLQRATTGSFAYTARQALYAATMGSARVLGLADRIGSLEPGKRADLVVLRLPPGVGQTYAEVVSHIVYSADPRDLRLVVVDGQILVRDGRLAGVDEEALWEGDREYFQRRRGEVGARHASPLQPRAIQ